MVTHGNPLRAARLAIICSVLSAGEASAGPPFRTDDPVPVALGHYELYTAAIGTHVKGDTSGGLPNVELTYRRFPTDSCKLAARLHSTVRWPELASQFPTVNCKTAQMSPPTARVQAHTSAMAIRN